MNRERMIEIIEGIAKLTGTSDIKRLASAITWHHEIEAMLRPSLKSSEGLVGMIDTHLASEQTLCDDYTEGYQYHYEFISKIQKLLSTATETASEVVKWISVEDRLPKHGQGVMTWFKHPKRDGWTPCTYNATNKEFIGIAAQVTHWYIPTPPTQNNSEVDSGWVSVNDKLPKSENEVNQKEYDVWITDYRITDVIFRDNKFMVAIEDHDGDFSHYADVDEVSFWMEQPKPPTQDNEGER